MTVLVDTSALLAVLDGDDPNHEAAAGMLEAALHDDAFTHNYVQVEAEQLVRRRLGAPFADRLLKEVLPALRTVWIDEGIHAEAVDALDGKGRGASLVDEVSFVLMRRLNVALALAFDSDFEREGFRRPEYQRRHTLSETRAPYGSHSEAADLVSVSELAARSGRSVNTIQSWRRRHRDFPSPERRARRRTDLAVGRRQRMDRATIGTDRHSPNPMNRVGDDPWISLTDLRRNFHRVIREVEGGQTFTISRRGEAVARLTAFNDVGDVAPTLPLFASLDGDIASRVDELLHGFGGR